MKQLVMTLKKDWKRSKNSLKSKSYEAVRSLLVTASPRMEFTKLIQMANCSTMIQFWWIVISTKTKSSQKFHTFKKSLWLLIIVMKFNAGNKKLIMEYLWPNLKPWYHYQKLAHSQYLMTVFWPLLNHKNNYWVDG